jgi:nucleotide-binding universal stress UspA family protein
MTTVIAAVDNSAASRPVVATALAIAPVLGATVEAVHVVEEGDATARAAAEAGGVPLILVKGDVVEELVALSREAEVAAVVVGARGRPGGRRPAGHVALELADHADAPVVVVPPDARPPERLQRVLVAMEGTPAKAKSLKRAIEVAAGAGLEMVVVHVDDETSIPSFSDQIQYEAEIYAKEFLTRFVPNAPDARLELRIGAPADEILSIMDDVRPEILAVGWPQTEEPARGLVVRQLLEHSHVPVLLVPLG